MAPSDPESPREIRVPLWALSILVGFLLVVVLLGIDRNLCNIPMRILFCIGAALMLVGVETQVFGQWKNWFIGGAGVIALFIFMGISFMYEDTSVCVNSNSQASSQLGPQAPSTKPEKEMVDQHPNPSQKPKLNPPSDPAISPLPGSLSGVLPQSVTSSLPESSQSPPREEESSRPQPQAPSPEPEKGTDAGPPAIPSEPQTAETSAPSASVQSLCPSPAKATPEGWVYVGTNLGRHWDVKHFNWDSYNKRLPERDDVLTAAGLVNLRERFGEHAPIVDVICPDEQVQVLETKTLSEGYHWVKVKRIKEKEGSP